MKTFSKNNGLGKIITGGIILTVLFVSLLSHSLVFAAGGVLSTNSSGCNGSTATSGTLPNPLCVSSISDILYLAVDIATYIGVVLAVIFLIYAGFKYIAARGNPTKIQEAHQFLLAVVIGIAILVGASAIVNVIKNTLTSAGVVSGTTFSAPSTGASTNQNSANCVNGSTFDETTGGCP